jgi:hypothetical protein
MQRRECNEESFEVDWDRAGFVARFAVGWGDRNVFDGECALEQDI